MKLTFLHQQENVKSQPRLIYKRLVTELGQLNLFLRDNSRVSEVTVNLVIYATLDSLHLRHLIYNLFLIPRNTTYFLIGHLIIDGSHVFKKLINVGKL